MSAGWTDRKDYVKQGGFKIMKPRMIKRLMFLLMAAVLLIGSSMTAFATEATGNEGVVTVSDGNVTQQEDDTETDDSEANTETSTDTETAVADTAGGNTETASTATETTNNEAAPASQTDAGVSPAAATTEAAEGNQVTTETPNTDITVIPSDANALILMDAGAQSPKAVPGMEVQVVLTMAVNREYLPSEKYVLRNITIDLDIPTTSTKDAWPFDIVNASYTRHLDDMTYNSTAEVWYTLNVSEFAKVGVYPVNFTVNATVWRQDDVNGTEITEDVEFPMNVFVTVVENGDMSGVTSAIGPLDIAGRENTAIASPVGRPGETVVMSVPIINKGGTLTSVTVSPVVTGDLETFPFITTDINYGRELGTMENGTRQTVDWPLTLSPYATTGNKVVTFRATYEENGVFGECTFKAYVYVKDGYVKDSAPSLMVESYGIYVNDKQVENVEAGQDAVIKISLHNNALYDTIYKTVANLQLADANSLILTQGYSDAAYVRSIGPGKSTEIEFHVTARASAAVGPSAATISLAYENQDVVQGTATSKIQIPIKQPMNLQLDTPVVYGTAVQGEPLAVSLNMVNLGRSRAYNVRVVGMDGISMQDAYFGGDILAAGTLNADLTIIPNKAGNFKGTLVVQYEDADGELYTQDVALELDAQTPEEEAAEVFAEQDSTTAGKNSDTSTNTVFFAGMSWLWLVVLLLVLLVIVVATVIVIRRRGASGNQIEEE